MPAHHMPPEAPPDLVGGNSETQHGLALPEKTWRSGEGPVSHGVPPSTWDLVSESTIIVNSEIAADIASSTSQHLCPLSCPLLRRGPRASCTTSRIQKSHLAPHIWQYKKQLETARTSMRPGAQALPGVWAGHIAIYLVLWCSFVPVSVNSTPLEFEY